jgi:orotate phosphoribosyltransferase
MDIQKHAILEVLATNDVIMYGDFTLASGAKSEYYINAKKLVETPKTLKFIAREIAYVINREMFETKTSTDIVAGVELGGALIATAVSLEAQLPLLVIRKEAKNYGTKSSFVGNFTQSDNIVVIEDVTTSGGSVINAIKRLQDAGGKVKYVISVVDREEGAKAALDELGIKFIPLVTIREIKGK